MQTTTAGLSSSATTLAIQLSQLVALLILLDQLSFQPDISLHIRLLSVAAAVGLSISLLSRAKFLFGLIRRDYVNGGNSPDQPTTVSESPSMAANGDTALSTPLPFDAVFAEAAVGMAWLNTAGEYVRVNNAFCTTLGYSKSEILALRWQQLTYADDLGATAQLMDLIHTGEINAFSLEKRIVTQSGALMWVLMHVMQISETPAVAERLYCTMIQDISDRKRIEQLLKARLAQERLVAKVNQRIQDASDIAEIMQVAVTEARYILQTDRVMICQLNPAGDGTVMVESVLEPWKSSLGQNIQDPCLGDSEYLESYRRGQIQNISDVLASDLPPRCIEFLQALQVRGTLMIPIVQGDTLWGLLIAQTCEAPRYWSQQDIDWLQQIASQLAIALQQTQTLQRLEYQVQREQATNRVIQAMSRSLNLSEVFDTAVTEIAKLLQVEWIGIVQYLPGRSVWRNVAEYKTTDQVPSALDCDIPDKNNPLAAQLKQRRIVRIVNSSQESSDPINENYAEQFPGAWLLVPIVTDKTVWGSLSIIKVNRCEAWRPDEVNIAQTMADQLAIAIQQSRLYQQVQRLAVLDGLTQVANRRYFNDQLEQEWQRMMRQRQPIALIMCDVDHFKAYNDTYGHQAGDRCLQQVAQALQRLIRRPGDLIARYGGEEFAIILPETPLSGAEQLATHICRSVEELKIPHRTSPTSSYVTISVGVTSRIPQVNFSVDQLIKLADQALYLAKSTGRNGYRADLGPSQLVNS
ncbi:MAG: diguanylate cyclase [Cyanobacteria bacterium P01_D01_bin.128]